MDNSAGIIADDTLGGTGEGLEGDFRYRIADRRPRTKTGQDKVQLQSCTAAKSQGSEALPRYLYSVPGTQYRVHCILSCYRIFTFR